MEKKAEKIRDVIFLITQEKSCPFYNVGEELKIESSGLSVSSYKPVCLYLAQQLKKITTSRVNFNILPVGGQQKSIFDCGGCDGLIRYEYKKDKDFATLQMKLLNEVEEQRRRRHLDKFFGTLRNLDFFESLDDDALSDLTLLLELKTIPLNKVILKKGDPGTYLFIILSGKVAIIADDGQTIAEIGDGQIFGEMSLLSGEPVTRSIYTIDGTQVAMLSNKNFKYVMKKYPVLQLFLLKMLVDRAQTMTLRSGQITSGMSGELAEIGTVDLLQLINSSQKTGTITLALDKGRAAVSFLEGEIIQAHYLELADREAVFALLGIKSGHFSYTKGISAEMENLQPVGGFMGMMMEGLQRIDEVA